MARGGIHRRSNRGGEINIGSEGCLVGQSKRILCLKMSTKAVRKTSYTSLPRMDPHKDEKLDRSGRKNRIRCKGKGVNLAKTGSTPETFLK